MKILSETHVVMEWGKKNRSAPVCRSVAGWITFDVHETCESEILLQKNEWFTLYCYIFFKCLVFVILHNPNYACHVPQQHGDLGHGIIWSNWHTVQYTSLQYTNYTTQQTYYFTRYKLYTTHTLQLHIVGGMVEISNVGNVQEDRQKVEVSE